MRWSYVLQRILIQLLLHNKIKKTRRFAQKTRTSRQTSRHCSHVNQSWRPSTTKAHLQARALRTDTDMCWCRTRKPSSSGWSASCLNQPADNKLLNSRSEEHTSELQ